MPLTLLTLIALVASWSPDTARDRWFLLAASATLVERAGTFGYFIPQLLTLLRPEYRASASAAGIGPTWMRLNRVRAVLAFVAWMAALRALSLSGLTREALEECWRRKRVRTLATVRLL